MIAKVTVFDGTTPVGSGFVLDGCIHDVEVTENHRRKGIGTKIIKALRNIGGTWLWVDTEDVGVMQFYEKCGFEVDEYIDGERFAVMRIPADPEEGEAARKEVEA